MKLKNKIYTILIFIKNKKIITALALDVFFYIYILTSIPLLSYLITELKSFEYLIYTLWLLIFITLVMLKKINKKKKDNLE